MVDTYVDSIDSTDLFIEVETDTPGTYAHPCLINSSRSYSKTAQTAANVVPRCDDASQPGKTVRKTTSTDSTISGAGKLTQSDAKAYNDMVGATKNIKVRVGSATGNLIVTGPYILEEFTLTGSGLGALVEASVKWSQADLTVATAAT